jgi:hypothetical protein
MNEGDSKINHPFYYGGDVPHEAIKCMATTYLAHLSGGSLLGGVTGWRRILPQRVFNLRYSFSIISAVIVIAIMLTTGLHLKGNDLGIGTLNRQVGISLSGNRGTPGTYSHVMDFGAKFTEPEWISWEGIFVNHGSPNEHPSCAVPRLNPVIGPYIQATSVSRLRSNNGPSAFRQERECEAIRKISRPNLPICEDYRSRYRSVATICPIQKQLVVGPLSRFGVAISDAERSARKVQISFFGCPRRFTGGFGDVVHFPSKDREYTSEYSRPHGSSSDSKKEIEYASHLWDFLLFTLAVSAFIATVGCLMYAFERGRPIFWFAALVCGYVWYLSVSALRI